MDTGGSTTIIAIYIRKLQQKIGLEELHVIVLKS